MDIKTLKKGMSVDDNFAVISIDKRKTSQNKTYLVAQLSHSSGTITGKVWEDCLAEAPLMPNKVFHIKGAVDVYRDIPNITVSQAYKIDDEKTQDYIKSKPTLVFDIETAGKDFDKLNTWDQDYLLNTLQKKQEDKKIAKQSTALYPLYAQVVAVGMFCPEKAKGSVLILSPKIIKLEDKNFKCDNFKTEKDLLKKFWDIFTKFEKYVTYNGKSFDIPFLQFRSAINEVKVPIEIKNYNEENIDLMQKFKIGYTPYKLEALCRAFEITNPKEKGVSGKLVSDLFAKKKYKEIADYVSRDAISTNELFQIWKKFIAGKIIV